MATNAAPQVDRLADALFPRTRQRLLAALFGQPERSFYVNELVRLAGSGIGGVQRELASLADSGLLTVEQRGNQTHYQANPESPIFDELSGIVRKTFGAANVLRAALSALSPRIDRAFIYGSYASGEAHAGSDIDLMVVADDLSLEELFSALGIAEASLGRHLSPTLYTRAEFHKRMKAQNPFLTKVLKTPRLALMGGDDGAD